MATKQMGIKEKEQNRKNAVLGMISNKVMETTEGKNRTDTIENNLHTDSGSETAESLKKQLEEAKAALKVQSTRKTRIKNTRVNLLMYKDIYDGLKKKCKKENISVNDCMNQLAERWVNEET